MTEPAQMCRSTDPGLGGPAHDADQPLFCLCRLAPSQALASVKLDDRCPCKARTQAEQDAETR